MSLNFLDFEQPIAELDAKIEELQLVNNLEYKDVEDGVPLSQSAKHLSLKKSS